jgi:mono/diheme cytochrome c family protein
MKRARGWMFVVPLALVCAAVGSNPSRVGAAKTESPSKGAVPTRPPADSASIVAGEKLFMKNCQICHGIGGHGDGPTGVALNPRPRDFTQPSQFKSKNDDEVFQVISKGGAARKLSAAMPPWGPKLKRDEIWQLIAYIRGFPARDSIAKANAPKK